MRRAADGPLNVESQSLLRQRTLSDSKSSAAKMAAGSLNRFFASEPFPTPRHPFPAVSLSRSMSQSLLRQRTLSNDARRSFLDGGLCDRSQSLLRQRTLSDTVALSKRPDGPLPLVSIASSPANSFRRHKRLDGSERKLVSIASSPANSFRLSARWHLQVTPEKVSIASSPANSFRPLAACGNRSMPLCLNRFFASELFPTDNRGKGWCLTLLTSQSLLRQRTLSDCWAGSLNRFFASEPFPTGSRFNLAPPTRLNRFFASELFPTPVHRQTGKPCAV
jgi:hypothetical protein